MSAVERKQPRGFPKSHMITNNMTTKFSVVAMNYY